MTLVCQKLPIHMGAKRLIEVKFHQILSKEQMQKRSKAKKRSAASVTPANIVFLSLFSMILSLSGTG